MKKLAAVIVVAALVFSLAETAWAWRGRRPGRSAAATVKSRIITPTQGPARKLGRGLANVVTSPLEIVKGLQDVGAKNGAFAGATWGTVQGLVKTVLRAGVGVYEIVTFPVPFPKGYEPILTDPEFFLQEY